MSTQQEGVRYVLTLQDLFSNKILAAESKTNALDSAIGRTQKSLFSLRNAFVTVGGVMAGREIVDSVAKFEALTNQFNFASGSAIKGAQDLDWLRQKVDYLGLDLLTSADAFAQFSASARQTRLEGEGVRQIFDAVASASTVMHLTAAESEGAFRALTQMLSKGKVQAEELRGQLGERIPGAFLIAARAMGMTTAELDKFMADGKLMAEDFLPKFAAQLKTEFAGGVEKSRMSVSANLNRMKNEFFELKVVIGELLMPVISGLISLLRSLVDMGKSVAEFISEHKKAFIVLGSVILSAASALLLYKTYLIATTVFMGAKAIFQVVALTAALEGVTIAQWLLNSATAFFHGLTGVAVFTVVAAGAALLAVNLLRANEAQEALNKSTKEADMKGVMNPLAQRTGMEQSKSPATDKISKAGTSTTAVETKGHQNFNIDIGNLIEKLEIKTTNLKESSAQIKMEVEKALIAAVNDFQLMATK